MKALAELPPQWCSSMLHDWVHLVRPGERLAVCGATIGEQFMWNQLAPNESGRKCLRCRGHEKKAVGWTAEQKRCIELLSEMAGGMHHLPTVTGFGRGVFICWPSSLDTFDHDLLTRLVLLAHQRGIRIELRHGGRTIKICAFARISSDNPAIGISERHPTLAALIAEAERMETAEQWKRLEGGNEG